ncbi:unannotated protein [freshwater metagenome]|uniref:Unannotated protein n=1 Tax=freshwater metagenome TaxID=449393 RepID=A0A6J6DKU9_9ZZZZ
MNCMFGFINVPCTVGIDSNAPLGTQCVSNSSNALDVVGQGRTGPGNLDLCRSRTCKPSQHGIDVSCRYSGHGRIHRDATSHDGRQLLPTELNRGSKPRDRFLVRVIVERAEFGPPLGPANDHGLANIECAKTRDKGQRHDVCVVEQLVERRTHLASLPYARRLEP